MIQSAIKNKNLLFPAIIGAGVLTLALSLLTIVARSPYTHSNLNLGFDSGYTRTQQMTVGEPVPATGAMLAVPRATDPIELGKQLFVSSGCAGCHGINAQGSIIGPAIVGIPAEKLRVKTNVGPKGMLPYAPGALSDQDLAAIAAYLQSMSK
jgi:mono/diheme cytochrome c family protein